MLWEMARRLSISQICGVKEWGRSDKDGQWTGIGSISWGKERLTGGCPSGMMMEAGALVSIKYHNSPPRPISGQEANST